jgi:hypothetical protein
MCGSAAGGTTPKRPRLAVLLNVVRRNVAPPRFCKRSAAPNEHSAFPEAAAVPTLLQSLTLLGAFIRLYAHSRECAKSNGRAQGFRARSIMRREEWQPAYI